MKTLLLAAATLASAASFAQTTAPSFHQPKKAQVAIAKTPAPASFLKAASKAPEMITEQPEGKLYKDMYGYSEGFISQWGMIYEDVKDGVARDFVVGDELPPSSRGTGGHGSTGGIRHWQAEQQDTQETPQ